MTGFIIDTDALALAPAALTGLVPFWLGYAMILAVPGPTNLMIGAWTAVHGVRATTGLRVAIACGAALQVLLISALLALLPDSRMASPKLPLLAAPLLLYAAWRMIRLRPEAGGVVARPSRGDIAFGLTCGLTNALSGSFFAAQFLTSSGTSSQALSAGIVAAISTTMLLAFGVFACSLTSTTLTALVFSMRGVNRWLQPRLRMIRWCACAAFCGASAAMVLS